MEPELLIAIIAGGTGALLGILGLLIAIVANVSAGRSARGLETLEHEFKQAAASDWMKNQELENTLKVRSRCLAAIQKLKDELDAVLRAQPGAMTRDAALQSISASGRALMSLQSEVQAKVSQVEQIALLRAKDAALEMSSRMRDALKGIEDAADLSDASRQVIVGLRTELTEAQLVFRDGTMNRMLKRMLDHGQPAKA